jgi:hypothetical protein
MKKADHLLDTGDQTPLKFAPRTGAVVMPNVIRSIPATYNGVTFRSITEARWAVFFDCLEIPWEFEPECEFLDGGPYLPDFKLWGTLLAEVKPALTTVAELTTQYEDLFERVRGLDNLLLLQGAPKTQWYPVLTLTPPCTFWIDLERSSKKGYPVMMPGARRPPVEDLSMPLSRFDGAVIAANNILIEQRTA